MTTNQILDEIDKIIRGIETDRFTLENLTALSNRIYDERAKRQANARLRKDRLLNRNFASKVMTQ